MSEIRPQDSTKLALLYLETLSALDFEQCEVLPGVMVSKLSSDEMTLLEQQSAAKNRSLDWPQNLCIEVQCGTYESYLQTILQTEGYEPSKNSQVFGPGFLTDLYEVRRHVVIAILLLTHSSIAINLQPTRVYGSRQDYWLHWFYPSNPVEQTSALLSGSVLPDEFVHVKKDDFGTYIRD